MRPYCSSTCLAILFLSQLLALSASADQEVYSAIIEAQSAREMIYGNGHFVWHARDVVDGEVSETKHEYWARENRYFRLDRQSIVEGKPTGSIRRVIAGPDGFVTIEASDADDPGVAYSSCGVDDGVKHIKGQYFIAMANRIATVQVQGWLKKWQGERSDLQSLDLVQNDPEGVVISFTRGVPNGTKKYEVLLSQGDYRVQSWKYRFEGCESDQHASQEATVTYDDEQKEIPIKTSDKASSNFAPPAEFECKLIEFQLEPAPMEVFAVKGVTWPTNPWIRRAVLLCIGVIFLGGYYVWRRTDDRSARQADQTTK